MAQDKQQGSMSVNEAGKKGGEATSASHDKEFYQEIGSKGGQNSGATSRMILSAPPKPAARVARTAAGTSPTIGKKPLKPDTKVVKTAMVAGATVDAPGAGERGSPAHFHSSEITAIA